MQGAGTSGDVTMTDSTWSSAGGTWAQANSADSTSDVILNGDAAGGYYEEILGRRGRYRAFWWSPDSSRLG